MDDGLNALWIKLFLFSKVLWDGFLTPEGSERVPTDLRILHDMIALLQENKIKNEKFQFQRTLPDMLNCKRHFLII